MDNSIPVFTVFKKKYRVDVIGILGESNIEKLLNLIMFVIIL